MVAERMQVEQVAMAAGKLALVAGELLLSDTGLRHLREDGSPDFTLREAASLAEDAGVNLTLRQYVACFGQNRVVSRGDSV